MNTANYNNLGPFCDASSSFVSSLLWNVINYRIIRGSNFYERNFSIWLDGTSIIFIIAQACRRRKHFVCNWMSFKIRWRSSNWNPFWCLFSSSSTTASRGLHTGHFPSRWLPNISSFILTVSWNYLYNLLSLHCDTLFCNFTFCRSNCTRNCIEMQKDFLTERNNFSHYHWKNRKLSFLIKHICNCVCTMGKRAIDILCVASVSFGTCFTWTVSNL